MKEEKKEGRGKLDYVYIVQRLVTILAIVAAFFPAFSPSRITKLIDDTISLFTSGVSYSSLTDGASRALRMEWVDETVFVVVFIGSLILMLGICLAIAGGCMSLGNLRLQRLGLKFSFGGSLAEIVGVVFCYISYNMIQNSENVKRVKPVFPNGMILYAVFAIILLVTTLILMAVCLRQTRMRNLKWNQNISSSLCSFHLQHLLSYSATYHFGAGDMHSSITKPVELYQ